jgi:hypothetical protein
MLAIVFPLALLCEEGGEAPLGECVGWLMSCKAGHAGCCLRPTPVLNINQLSSSSSGLGSACFTDYCLDLSVGQLCMAPSMNSGLGDEISLT